MDSKEISRISVADALHASPFKMLQAHFDRAIEAVHMMRDMIAAYCDGDYTRAESISVEISRLEHEADEIKRHMRSNLPRMILMPISRVELLDILNYNERIADRAQDVAQILDMRRTEIPDSIKPLVRRFVGHVIDSVDALSVMMDHIKTLLQSTFARVEVDEVVDLGHHVHEHEYKADVAMKELSKAIYGLEDSQSPVALMHLHRFTEVLDSVADQAENTALRMVVIVSR